MRQGEQMHASSWRGKLLAQQRNHHASRGCEVCRRAMERWHRATARRNQHAVGPGGPQGVIVLERWISNDDLTGVMVKLSKRVWARARSYQNHPRRSRAGIDRYLGSENRRLGGGQGLAEGQAHARINDKIELREIDCFGVAEHLNLERVVDDAETLRQCGLFLRANISFGVVLPHEKATGDGRRIRKHDSPCSSTGNKLCHPRSEASATEEQHIAVHKGCCGPAGVAARRH